MIFLGSPRFARHLAHERVLVLGTVLGIFLAALAVQLIFAGVLDLFTGTST
ncbi:small neutral amino acid transporter SnatA (MarC family) [Methanofollis sp. W23]|nr:small neutral amino acid transporter SnatA (MarC family) [Methanofollis sp. W23]